MRYRMSSSEEFGFVDNKYQQKAKKTASDSFVILQKEDTIIMREIIITLAEATGFWLIWIRVFYSDKDMIWRIMKAFCYTLIIHNSFTMIARNWYAISRAK